MSDVRVFYSKRMSAEDREDLTAYQLTPDRVAKTAANALASSVIAIEASRLFGVRIASVIGSISGGVDSYSDKLRTTIVDE